MISKLNKLTTWQASLIITVLGFAVYLDGLKNQFLGDDSSQIVNNPVVHSIAHIRLFFEGGTFYVGNGLAPLYGVYFRPLMTTVYSLLYTLFGPHPFFFHLLQLLLCIGSSIILYLFFKFSFKPALALFLSLVFLVHPIGSQVVFAISSMQDALFFFFGISALYLLVRFKSSRSLIAVAGCLFLSILAKEVGVMFIALSLLYLFWWDRKRIYTFLATMVLPIILYVALRINAIGLLGANPNNAPIDKLDLAQRLLTTPSILLFYITKFIFPWKLASAYYWVFPTFSFTHFLLPLIVDLALVALVIYVAFEIRKQASQAMYYTYLFFAVWCGLGLLTILQIVPLDGTANEAWFYFSMAGLLGMVGVVISTLGSHVRINRSTVFAVMVAVILILGVRTAVRGPDWSNINTLAFNDVKVSKEDYVAYGVVGTDLYNQGKLNQALTDEERSISIFPSGNSYGTLCSIYFKLDDGHQAEQACVDALKYPESQTAETYTNAALLMFLYGNPNDTKPFILSALTKYPQDADLWLYLALLEYKNGDSADARVAISTAHSYGQTSTIDSAYTVIMNNEKLTL